MELNTSKKHLKRDPVACILYDFLEQEQEMLKLETAQVYHDFPLYKDEEGGVIETKMLLISQSRGVIVFETSNLRDLATSDELEEVDSRLDQVCSHIMSRLIRNRRLRSGKTELKFSIEAGVYMPALKQRPTDLDIETKILMNNTEVEDFLNGIEQPFIAEDIFQEIMSTIEGAKGLIRPKKRQVEGQPDDSKVYQVLELESEISRFDKQQRHGYVPPLDGPQRIRGIAGSGKTVVLAMKAAITHLRYPEARIVYTFYTKSLYQHIKRLITRFYRQFDDQDPDWDQLKVEHAWGGYTGAGVYFDACRAHDVSPMNFREARARSIKDPFDYACSKLLKETNVKPIYDYVFIDEGQDFGSSFLKLCRGLAEDERFILAYDELQTIWQAKAPAYEDIFGNDDSETTTKQFVDDIVLYKCYRNPKEILVCAHALGFSIYGERIVQMLENKEHWEDVGYKVLKGRFVEGSETEIERPDENSLMTISRLSTLDEIVHVEAYEKPEKEIESVEKGIKGDLAEGLRPDDILVIAVDDRNAKYYLRRIDRSLRAIGIRSNNLHSDMFNLRDFQEEGCVTLSTVHKAKGNEAFMVYIVGVDALFRRQDVRLRNMLFTAMTRAKGWVRISGVGGHAQECVEEVREAKKNFPFLKFTYPSEEELKIMKRDLAESAIRKQVIERKLDEIMELGGEDMSPEELRDLWETHLGKYAKKRKSKKGKKK